MKEDPVVALVRATTTELTPTKLRPLRMQLHAEQVIPYRPVEVVTHDELRLEEQARHKAAPPEEAFYRSPAIEPPLTEGVSVNTETLLGFLDALDLILPPGGNYPLLSSARLIHPGPADTPKLFIEAGSHAVWTTIVLRADGAAPKGFETMIPVRRARNVLKALRDIYPTVVVGVDEMGVVLGPYTVPFGGVASDLKDFPSRPVFKPWVARAAMPATYFRDICERVLVARSSEFKDVALQGALIDFEQIEVDEETRILATVVATDGQRMHVLRLPQMMIEVESPRIRAMPPTCTVSAGFFAFLRAIIQHEWAALEFSGDQLLARGKDFLVVARAPAEGRSSLDELAGWRRYNIEWAGCWLLAKARLDVLLATAAMDGTAEFCRIRINGRTETVTVSSTGGNEEDYSERMSARNAQGPMTVNVLANIRFLREAIAACTGGLLRLGFDHDLNTQATSPIVIRGEDEQFKAILMPVAEGEP